MWGTRNQYFNLTDQQELELVLDGEKPVYLGNPKAYATNEIDFAKRNGLLIGKHPYIEGIVITKTKNNLDAFLNAKTYRELGLALGYEDLGRPISKSELIEILNRANKL